MKKLIKYTTGEVYLQTSAISIGIHGGQIDKEVDVSNFSDIEIEKIKQDLENN